MAKDIFQINAGVKLCSNCEHNIRCAECHYMKRYEALAEKHDALIGENVRLREELRIAKANTTKEFSHRLRIRIGFARGLQNQWLLDIIKNLEKEMAGDEQ